MTRRAARRGVAPLEFAMVLPLLVLLMVVTWHAAHVGHVRTGAASEAREKAWAKRGDCDPGIAFDLTQDPLMSYVGEEVEKVVPRKSPITGHDDTAKANTGVTDKTHDFEQFPFPELKAPGGRHAGRPDPVARIEPHTEQIEHFGEFIPLIMHLDGRVKGFSAMDPRVNGRLAAFVPEAAQFRVERKEALVEMAARIPEMIAAARELADLARALAYTAPPLAAWYAYEAWVILRGIRAAGWLISSAETR